MLDTLVHYLKKISEQMRQSQTITYFDIVIFWRQLSTLISAGISILQCCEALEKSQDKLAMRMLIFNIKRELLAGKNFFTSLHHHKNYFDDMTCQLIKIGEHTGKLEKILALIAQSHEKKLAFNKQLKNALFYPSIIIVAALIISMSMFIFVIPRFAELFKSMHTQLPLFTRIIFYLSEQLNTYCIWILLFMLVTSTICFYLFSKLKIPWLSAIENFPIVKNYIHKLMIARFARNLAITFSAGIPITNALTLTANTCGHSKFSTYIHNLSYKVSVGTQLHRSLQAYPVFPSLLIHMVKIGEDSGMLDHMLDKVAFFFENEVEQQLALVSQLLEPLIMVVLGVLIGGLVVGMYLPIFKLGSTF